MTPKSRLGLDAGEGEITPVANYKGIGEVLKQPDSGSRLYTRSGSAVTLEQGFNEL